ncbi:MAG: M48 family metalloprotease [Planctomycetes bacterium]|nr:M48 family metalloprotease [Planctomycetota bacterium]
MCSYASQGVIETAAAAGGAVRRAQSLRKALAPPQLLRWLSSLLLLAVLTAPGLLGCCRDLVTGESFFCLGELSVAEEVELGAAVAPSFLAQSGGRYPDLDLGAYLREIVVTKLAPRTHRPELPWSFDIVNSSQPNAFALPGGKVFITRGLLARLETEGQFAHLMGHELGHICHRHALRGQGRSALFDLLLGIIIIGTAERQVLQTGPDDPLLVTSTAGAIGNLAFLPFDRGQELESDQRGIDYALAAGYDPREGRKTFEMFLRIKREAGQRETVFDELFNTHPLDERRIDEIDDYIAERHPAIAAGQRHELIASRPEFENQIGRLRQADEVYARLDTARALIGDARKRKNQSPLDSAEEILRGCARDLPQHARFPVALAVVAMERKNPADALRHLDRACALDPQLFEARFFRGVVYRETMKWDSAREELLAAHELFPMSPFPSFLLGEVCERLEDPAEAAKWYRAAIDVAPAGSEVERRARARLRDLRHAA